MLHHVLGQDFTLKSICRDNMVLCDFYSSKICCRPLPHATCIKPNIKSYHPLRKRAFCPSVCSQIYKYYVQTVRLIILIIYKFITEQIMLIKRFYEILRWMYPSGKQADKIRTCEKSSWLDEKNIDNNISERWYAFTKIHSEFMCFYVIIIVNTIL